MAGIKRKASDINEFVSKATLLDKIIMVDKLRDQALIVFCYLSGGRISELVKARKKGTRFNKYEYPGVKKEQVKIEYYNDKAFVILYQIPILKRRGTIPMRNIPIPFEHDKDMASILLTYVGGLKDDQALFPITRQRAWQLIRKHTGWFPHYFRHLRNTHLVTDYNFSSSHLKEFNGWASSRPADFYIHLNWKNVADRMNMI